MLPDASQLAYYMLRAGDPARRRPRRPRRPDAREPARGLARARLLPAGAARARRVGRDRDAAYRIVQRDARRAVEERRPFREVLEEDEELVAALGPSASARCSTRPSISTGRCATPTAPSTRWRRSGRDAASALYSGKVRDIYDAGDGLLLMVASDRISAFDVVFDEPIPDKGRVLTAMTAFWASELADDRADAPRHRRPGRLPASTRGDPAGPRGPGDARPAGRDAADRVHRARLPRRLGLEGVPRAPGRCTASRSRRAASSRTGSPSRSSRRRRRRPTGHDVNISFDEAAALVGAELAERAREVCLAAYSRGAARALERGIVIADTKFELGMIDGELAICDEILTPDSSRFWPARRPGSPGATPPSFDKQPVRDWADGDGLGQGVATPADARRGRRRDPRRATSTAYERISGLAFWPTGGACGGTTRELRRRRRDPRPRRASPIPRARPSSGRSPRSASPACATSTSARSSASRSRPPTRPTRGDGVEEMCDRLLANPVIERAEVRRRRATAGGAGS